MKRILKATILLLNLFLFAQCSVFERPIVSQSGIYVADKTFQYCAIFKDSDQQVLVVDTIILTTVNQSLLLQNKIIWKLIHYATLTPTQTKMETTEDITGLVDNENELWMHPPRFKAYEYFTEFAPFPKIKFPAKVGTKWTDKFSLGTYASEKNGSEVVFDYKILTVDTISVNPIVKQFLIAGTGKSKLGEFHAQFYFNEMDGFTRMEYISPERNTLSMQLVESIP